jgi:hypothetical protein
MYSRAEMFAVPVGDVAEVEDCPEGDAVQINSGDVCGCAEDAMIADWIVGIELVMVLVGDGVTFARAVCLLFLWSG